MGEWSEMKKMLLAPEWTQSWRHRAMAVTFLAMAVYCASVQIAFSSSVLARLKSVERGLMALAFFLGGVVEHGLGLSITNDEVFW